LDRPITSLRRFKVVRFSSLPFLSILKIFKVLSKFFMLGGWVVVWWRSGEVQRSNLGNDKEF
jgi:hypothetical protein